MGFQFRIPHRPAEAKPSRAKSLTSITATMAVLWLFVVLPLSSVEADVDPRFPDPKPAAHFNLRYKGTTISTLGYYQVGVYISTRTTLHNIDLLDKLINSTEKVLLGMSWKNSEIVWAWRRTSKRLRLTLQTTIDLGEQIEGARRTREATQEAYGGATFNKYAHAGAHTEGFEEERHRRFVPLVGLGIKLAGTLFGLYKTAQLHQMKREMEEQGARIDDLYRIVEDHTTTLGRHALQIQGLEEWARKTEERLWEMQWANIAQAMVGGFIEEIEAQVAQIGVTMDLLISQQLSHRALQPGAMRTLLSAISEEVQKTGYELLVGNQAEAFQSRASFMMTEDGFMGMLHLPLAKKGDLMNLYEYVPIPIPLADGHHMTVHPRMGVIAVSEDSQSFRAMSLADLTTCDLMGDLHLCSNANLRTNKEVTEAYDGQADDQLCILFLFSEQYEHIRTACQFHIDAPTDHGYQLSGTDFVFAGPEVHQGVVQCEGRTDQTFQVAGVTQVRVAPGCTAVTKYFTATGAASGPLATAKRAFDWPHSMADLTGEVDLTLLSQLEHNRSRDDIPTETHLLAHFLQTEKARSRLDQADRRALVAQESARLAHGNAKEAQEHAEQAHLRSSDANHGVKRLNDTNFVTWGVIGLLGIIIIAAAYAAYRCRPAIIKQVELLISRAVETATTVLQLAIRTATRARGVHNRGLAGPHQPEAADAREEMEQEA